MATITGRFEAEELVRARRRFDAAPAGSVGSSATRAADVCAARRRFDGALGREGAGGAESFQPKFTRRVPADDVFAPDEPLLVIDLDAGTGTLTFPLPDLRDLAAAADQELRRAALAHRARVLLARIDEERRGAGVIPRSAPTPMPPMRPADVTPMPPGQPAGFTPMPPVTPTPVVLGPRARPATTLDATVPGFDAAVAKLRTLGALRNEGLISDAEYERKKADLLAYL